jgi:hypothetical protein
MMRTKEDSKPISNARDAKIVWETIKFMCFHPFQLKNIH